MYDVDLSGTALNTQTTDYSYNGAAWQTSVSTPDPESDDGSATPGYLTTATTYDADGNVLTETDPMGNVTTDVYDAAGRLTRVYLANPTDGSATPSTTNSTLSTTNPETIYTYDTAGNLYSVEGATGIVTTYLHDALSRETEIEQTDPITNGSDGNANTSDYSRLITSFTYDGDSNVMTTTDPMGHVTSFGYDIFDNTTSVTLPSITATGTDGTGSSSTSPESESAYDNLGDLLSTTDANGRETTFSYNTLGEQVLVRSPDPGGDQTIPFTATTYDTLGNVLSQTDALSDQTSNAYDGFDHLASVEDADTNVTTYDSDALGNVLSETDAAVTSNTTYFAYDSLNRLTSRYETVATDATHTTTATTSYLHDADGDLTQTTDPDGHIITDTYDHLNRESEENWYADSTALADSDPTNTIDYHYNLAGQLTAANDDASGYSYEYDTLGRTTQIDNLGGESDGTSGVPDVALRYGYNADGMEKSLSATVGGTADFLNTYAYNTAGSLTSITQQGQTDGNAVADKLATFQYDAAGDTTGISRYDATTETSLVASSQFAFDADDRLTSLAHTAANGTTTYAAYAWTYDGADRVTSFINDANIGDYSAENVGLYSYDPASQLTGAAAPGGGTSSASNTLANTYDGNGNPTNSGDVVGAGNRLLSDGTFDYAFDANGNTISQTRIATGDVIDYAYDIRNRLVGVTNYLNVDGTLVETQHVAYSYDLIGNLIGRSITPYTDGVAGTTTTSRIVFDPTTGQMVLAFDGSGDLTTRVLNGAAVDQILATETVSSLVSPGAVDWMLGDNQGTVRDIVDAGGLVDHLSYDPFGDLTGESGSDTFAATDTIFAAYTGSFYDSATGLQWDGARMYKPSIERWLQQDPSGLGPDSNPYRYVGNSPTNLSDPSGLAPPDYVPYSLFSESGPRPETLPDLNGTPGPCPRDNIPANFSPGSALPTLPTGTFTDVGVQEILLTDGLGRMMRVDAEQPGPEVAARWAAKEAADQRRRADAILFGAGLAGYTGIPRVNSDDDIEHARDVEQYYDAQDAAAARAAKLASMENELGVINQFLDGAGPLDAYPGLQARREDIGVAIGRAKGYFVPTEPSSGTLMFQGATMLAGPALSMAQAATPAAAVVDGEVCVAADSGGISYGELDGLGRPTGVNATITQDMIGTGTPANPEIIPPGWSGNGTVFNEARGHLLGAQLGGSGDVAENLVTLQQNPANSPVMRGFETTVRDAVENGEVINYSATPIYDGDSLVPRGITLSGSGSGGFGLDVSVLNPAAR